MLNPHLEDAIHGVATWLKEELVGLRVREETLDARLERDLACSLATVVLLVVRAHGGLVKLRHEDLQRRVPHTSCVQQKT